MIKGTVVFAMLLIYCIFVLMFTLQGLLHLYVYSTAKCLIFALLCVLYGGYMLQAQSTLDTISLPAAIVVATNPGAGFSQQWALDSALLHGEPANSLGRILANNSSVYVKSYGTNGVSTLALRGGSAAHSPVVWNGMPITNSMLGSNDLSLLPSHFADEVYLNLGAASLNYTTGGIGGAIYLGKSFDAAAKHKYIALSTKAGSFGQFAGLLKTQMHSKYWQWKCSAEIKRERNDFALPEGAKKYVPIAGNETIYQSPENLNQQSVGASAYYQRGKTLFAMHTWWLNNSRNLVPIINQLHSVAADNEQQYDRSFRQLFKFNYSASQKLLTTTAIGYSYEYLVYKNQNIFISDTSRLHRYFALGQLNYRLAHNSALKASVQAVYTTARHPAYGLWRNRNMLHGQIRYLSNTSKKLQTQIALQQTLVDGKLQQLLPAAYFKFKNSPSANWVFNANVAKNYRLPTLNDLYWQPGGNPDLLPENAFQTEVGVQYSKRSFTKTWQLLFGSSLYANWVENWILWQPLADNSTIWQPVNVRKVFNRGIETNLQLQYLMNDKTSYILTIAPTFTLSSPQNKISAIDNTVGKQLIYVPKWRINQSLQIKYGQLNLRWVNNFTSKRFTDNTNNSIFALSSFFISDFYLHYNFLFKNRPLKLSFYCHNITNRYYELMSRRPQPGRIFKLSATFTFNL